jgi:hypothetical protein
MSGIALQSGLSPFAACSEGSWALASAENAMPETSTQTAVDIVFMSHTLWLKNGYYR